MGETLIIDLSTGTVRFNAFEGTTPLAPAQWVVAQEGGELASPGNDTILVRNPLTAFIRIRQWNDAADLAVKGQGPIRFLEYDTDVMTSGTCEPIQ